MRAGQSAAARAGRRREPRTTGDGQGGVPAAGARPAPGHLVTALTGLREPIVVLLLIIGFMSSISGKPLDGLLILLAGACLAWDAGRRSRQTSPAEASPAEASAATASPVQASPQGPPRGGQRGGGRPGGPGGRHPDRDGRGAPAPASRRPTPRSGAPPAPIAGGPPASGPQAPAALLAAGLAGGVLYAVVVGSFSRYSWPATVAVAGLGAAVVAIGWRGPRHTRPAPPRPPAVGLALWGAVFVAGCLWELWSLLEQPNLATSSYAHPTISTLTDPVLSTWAGRSVVLAAWLGSRLVPGGTVNSHDVTVLGYLAVLLAGIVLQLLATRTRAPIPPLGKVLRVGDEHPDPPGRPSRGLGLGGAAFLCPLTPQRRTGTAAILLESQPAISACPPWWTPSLSTFRDTAITNGRAGRSA